MKFMNIKDIKVEWFKTADGSYRAKGISRDIGPFKQLKDLRSYLNDWLILELNSGNLKRGAK